MDLLKSILISVVLLALVFFGIYSFGKKDLLKKAEINLARAQDLYEFQNDANGALRLLELEPQKELQEDYYFLKFRILFGQQKLYEAEGIAQKLLKINPNNTYYNYLIATLYYNTGDYKKSEKLLLKSIELEPLNSDYKLYLARLYENWGKEDKALDVLEKIIKEDSNYEAAYQDAASIYQSQNKNEKALKLWSEASKKFNYNDYNVYALANLYEKIGNKKLAVKYFKEVKDNDPYGNTDAANRIFKLTKQNYVAKKQEKNKSIISCKTVNKSCIAELKINGKDGVFKIEPEAPNTIIYEQFVNKNKNITSNSFGVLELKNGKKDAKPVCYINFETPNKTIKNNRAYIIKNGKEQLDGVIGENVLNNLNYDLDYQNKKLIIYN